MKKKIIIIISVLIVFIVVFLYFRMNEDSWIKDKRGVWIKHGNPAGTPDYVLKQQKAIGYASVFYNREEEAGAELSSQCLGSFDDYSFDIVNVPRTAEDNQIENQCEDYILGRTAHFIELDKDGNIVRIV